MYRTGVDTTTPHPTRQVTVVSPFGERDRTASELELLTYGAAPKTPTSDRIPIPGTTPTSAREKMRALESLRRSRQDSDDELEAEAVAKTFVSNDMAVNAVEGKSPETGSVPTIKQPKMLYSFNKIYRVEIAVKKFEDGTTLKVPSISFVSEIKDVSVNLQQATFAHENQKTIYSAIINYLNTQRESAFPLLFQIFFNERPYQAPHIYASAPQLCAPSERALSPVFILDGNRGRLYLNTLYTITIRDHTTFEVTPVQPINLFDPKMAKNCIEDSKKLSEILSSFVKNKNESFFPIDVEIKTHALAGLRVCTPTAASPRVASAVPPASPQAPVLVAFGRERSLSGLGAEQAFVAQSSPTQASSSVLKPF